MQFTVLSHSPIFSNSEMDTTFYQDTTVLLQSCIFVSTAKIKQVTQMNTLQRKGGVGGVCVYVTTFLSFFVSG